MDSFTLDFKGRMYFMLINYLIHMRNTGHERIDKHLFELLRKRSAKESPETFSAETWIAVISGIMLL
ncbi:MAG: hypothetical protein IPG02_00150 [Ignavibacteria bacterium]|nr:hypothetical protein [Ignavibacteria bacterium]